MTERRATGERETRWSRTEVWGWLGVLKAGEEVGGLSGGEVGSGYSGLVTEEEHDKSFREKTHRYLQFLVPIDDIFFHNF